MSKKKVFKIGDRVLNNENQEVYGVIVHKRTNESKFLSPECVWSVHWYNPTPYMKDRGIYSENDITKYNPNCNTSNITE